MAADGNTTNHLKFQTRPIKIKRRRRRETTVTTNPASVDSNPTTTAHISRKINTHIISSPDNTWCCRGAAAPSQSAVEPTGELPLSSSSDLKIRATPSNMGSSTTTTAYDSYSSSFSKFNSALTAGLLNPMSPPPPVDKTRASPSLFEIMANESDCQPIATTEWTKQCHFSSTDQTPKPSTNPPQQDKQTLIQQRLMDLLASRSPGNRFNDASSGDVKLYLSSKDGVTISISVHRQILMSHSGFFALKLNENCVTRQRHCNVEIADCDDIEVYIETLRLMYCKDLRKKLMKEDVPRVLDILKVSAEIGFDAGVLSCLEYLEAAPWAEHEEEKVASLLSELHLEGVRASEVLKRVSLEGAGDRNDNEEVLLKLLKVVLEGKDEKARREMKILVTKMLRENSLQNDLRKESLYFACNSSLNLLRHHFLLAAQAEMKEVGQIAQQADNLHWLLDIMIDRQIGEEFLKKWAEESELSEAHSKVPSIHRYEVSRVTARLFVGIGKRQLLASKESRLMLLQTWLVPFYEDFGWMKRATRGLDRHLIEDGLSSTISTLPMAWQKDILLSWFERFMNRSDDCPNIQRGFETWWRRAFLRRNGEILKHHHMRIVSDVTEKS